jgi:signal transduction histidine kinase
MFQPIYPQNDPNTVVGLVGTSIHWEDVLTNVVPDYVNGLVCVVSTDTSAFTFKIRNGKPELVGEGDLHDRAYTSFGNSVILNDFETFSATSAVYTLTVYPTTEIFDAFSTKSPTTVALGFAGVIAGVACLFFGYDYLVRREAKQRNTILEMKRRFVRFISHEIRTPLNTVCMGLELLQSELKPRKRKGADVSSTGQVADVSSTGQVADEDIGFWLNVTEEINENAHVAVEILNDLLNYDKLETGTLELENEPVLIWDLIEKTFNQFGIQAVNGKIDFKLEMERPSGAFLPDLEIGPDSVDPYNVIGDRIRLSEVIRNVLSNALKFTPEDGTIQVTATYVPNGLPNAKPTAVDGEEGPLRERAGSIQVCVKDSGVGLSTEQLSLLFSEGVQFDANRLQHGGGSGLGLNIAKGLVEQHHGLIYAESKGIGDGTTFTIELPLYSFLEEDLERFVDRDSTANSTAHTAYNSTSEFSSIDAEDFKLVTRRLLVAEDSASSRKMFVRLLERAGNVCVPPAANGKEAVNIIKEDILAAKADPDHVPIYCILMDYEMPLLNGPEATKQLRTLGYKGIILGITGNVLSEDIECFKEHGADEVMSKPVSLKHIQKYWKEHQNVE